ncbi:unnamed protein product [Dibothriocephalus latus]|uniref:Uncharacterized protein n=1 Tax=Dibothriocephalus latus TaxID=60516 RepID=A0A3P7NXB1_DIBLA|nr:unnamed protein product [Dibothriocephalus latus]
MPPQSQGGMPTNSTAAAAAAENQAGPMGGRFSLGGKLRLFFSLEFSLDTEALYLTGLMTESAEEYNE